jgi:hypothetical protein
MAAATDHEDISEDEERSSRLGHIERHEPSAAELRLPVRTLRLRLEHEVVRVDVESVLAVVVAQDVRDRLQLVEVVARAIHAELADHASRVRRRTSQQRGTSVDD